MASIFERLSFNFDSSKFGDIELLGNTSIDYYNSISTNLKDWQYQDIINSTAGREQYFVNPVSQVCSDIKISANSLYLNSLNVSFENDETTGNLISPKSQDVYIEIDEFKSHTDNVSGVSTLSMSQGIPSYDLMVAVGNEITRLIVTEENIANTSGVFGSATSLFVGDDLDTYLTILQNDVDLVDSSIRLEEIVDPEDPNTTIQIEVSNLTIGQVASVYNNVSSLYTLINTRRTEDWQFFQNSLDILSDLANVTRFTYVGNTQISLINQYIGTEKLKTIIANT
jgi:hypothetical protein